MSTAEPPLPQHLAALALAHEVRGARCAVKRSIAVGAMTAAAIVLDPPDCTLNMSIYELLASQRRWGATRCRTFLAAADLREAKTVGSLTERQRRVLARMLR